MSLANGRAPPGLSFETQVALTSATAGGDVSGTLTLDASNVALTLDTSSAGALTVDASEITLTVDASNVSVELDTTTITVDMARDEDGERVTIPSNITVDMATHDGARVTIPTAIMIDISPYLEIPDKILVDMATDDTTGERVTIPTTITVATPDTTEWVLPTVKVDTANPEAPC